MSTVLRIKRRLDEEPSESIYIRSKRSRKENDQEGAADASSNETSTVLRRVGTVESKEEPIEPLVLKAIKKGWELRESYKKLRSDVTPIVKSRIEAKRRAISKRYKIISQSRGLGEPQNPITEDEPSTESGEKDAATTACEGTEASSSSAMELTYFDAIPTNERDDVITCNQVPMESEKYVYDIFYSTQPVNWEDVMERNVCHIESEEMDFVNDSDSCESYEYEDDDENAEENWRNDYPDYDDSPCEDAEEYLNSQLKRYNMQSRDGNESYDQDDYDEDEGFDVDGNLITAANYPLSLISLMKKTRLEDSEEDSDD